MTDSNIIELSNYWKSWINYVNNNYTKYSDFVDNEAIKKTDYTLNELIAKWVKFENILEANKLKYTELYTKFTKKISEKENLLGKDSKNYINPIDFNFYKTFFNNKDITTNTDTNNVIKCLNDKCSSVFKSGEYCTIHTSHYFGYYDINKPENVFNKSIVIDDVYIDKYINNIIDSKKTYSICNLKNGVAYTNCALMGNSPWFTLNNNNDGCRVPSDLKLDNGFKIDGNKLKLPENSDLRKYGDINGYCQEKWYDWFTIPDYHLGNIYYNKKKTLEQIKNGDSSVNDIEKCYKPCDIGYMPYNITDNELRCVKKDDYNSGIYKNTSHYTPLAFINLLGNNDKDLKKYYKNILTNTSNIIVKNEYKELKSNIFDFINNTDSICNNIISEATVERSKRINDFLNITKGSFNHNNVIEPNNRLLEVINPSTSLFKLEHSYNICKKLYDAEQNKNDDTELNNIKENLKDIIALDQSSSSDPDTIKNNFDKLFNILKKASNICFSGDNNYSKNYVLYTLNKNNLLKTEYTPFKFDIIPLKIEKEVPLINKDAISSNIDNTRTCPVEINAANENIKYFDDEINTVSQSTCPQSEYKWEDPFAYITIFIYIFIAFFIIFLMINIFEILGPYIVILINRLLVFMDNSYYKFSDNIKSKYDAPEYDVKEAKRNLTNAVRRLSVVRDSLRKS